MSGPSAGQPRATQERRAGLDRRRSARDRRDAGHSWFGELGLDEAAWQHHDASLDALSAPGALTGPEVTARPPSGPPAFQRLYRAFVAARAAIGVLLVIAQVIAGSSGSRAMLPLLLCVGYAAQAMTLWLLPHLAAGESVGASVRLTRLQWFATVGVDLVVFSLLHVGDTSTSLNYGALLVIPVLIAGVFTRRLPALAVAAAVALLLLGSAAWSVAAGAQAGVALTQAGLAGGGLFIVSVLASELAARLQREELTARGSLELARQQAQLNRLVIEEMSEGVLVVDRKGRVRTANPAARALLVADGVGAPAPFPLAGQEAWRPVMQAVERAFTDGHWPDEGRDVTLKFSADSQRTLRTRVRFTRRRDGATAEDVCVLFIEDVLSVQARVRQEKLAAMGRVSAGIAHEIRNPLAAIAQANALLSEDNDGPAHDRLTSMVASNVERLKRIVDDVLEVAPGGATAGGAIDSRAAIAAVADEWQVAKGLDDGESCPLRIELPGEELWVRFDAEHLRRVLVNLLDNGLRHASGKPASVRLRLVTRDAREASLSVASDGPPITREVEHYLFEPFFSTRSRGTGLGLYICRELCERNGARIDFRRLGADHAYTNEFVVSVRREAMSSRAPTLQSTP